jgi:hypothetical protein
LTRRLSLALFLAGLLVALAAASLQRVPGYMDAEYYYAGALRLAEGQGGSEPYLWNYLNNPAGLPAPSFAYWMPGSSLLASLGLILFKPFGFWGARIGFILLAACLAPLTALLAYRISGELRHARLAGLLALFPGFYLAYLTTTDAFPIYMVLGALFLLAAGDNSPWWSRRPFALRMLFLGALVGLLHMTRADGLLWAAAAGFSLLLSVRQSDRPAGRMRAAQVSARLAAGAMALFGGYVLVSFPWYLRNLNVWGALLPPGGGRALWITEYEQTMIFPAALLTYQNWLAAGWAAHLQTWLQAASNNLQTSIAVQGSIVLFPFMLIGAWKLRGCSTVRIGAGMWLLTAGVMTLVFPFAGINGSFFHSGAALQPFLWALAPVGIETVMLWYARKRRLAAPQTMVRFMGALLVVVSLLLSGVLYYQRVVGAEANAWAWNVSAEHYQAVEGLLKRYGAAQDEGVLVNNPPGYWLASQRPAVVIPYGDEQVLLTAARTYDIRYLVLEISNPRQLGNLYHGRVNPPELEFLGSAGKTRLYRIRLEKE